MNVSLTSKPMGALWPNETLQEGKPRRLAMAIVAALAIESALVGTVMSVHMPAPAAKPPVPVMRIRMAQIDTPPPPPPPPVVHKIVRHESELPTPHHVIRPAAPKPQHVPVPDKTPTPVPTQEAPVNVQAAPSVSTPAPSRTAPAAPSAAAPAEPADVAIVCPVQVKPQMPARALAENIVGSVTARATIRGGRVASVDIVSATPPGVFDAAVRRAMQQYQCKVDGGDQVVVEQTFDFSESD